MNSTALGAGAENALKSINFISNAHEKFYKFRIRAEDYMDVKS